MLQLRESEERAAYILMDRINPPIQESVIISNGSHYSVQTNSELGIYGLFIRYLQNVCLPIYIAKYERNSRLCIVLEDSKIYTL